MNRKLEKEFQDLIKVVKEHDEKANIEKIKFAWEFAKIAHTDQKRLSGEPFVNHPLQTAKILAEWRLDSTSIIAALLHDTIEDGGAVRADIVKEFGEEVALLVDGVTKVTALRLKGSKEEVYTENLRKLLLVMAKDLRVVLVKLADRFHNMRTLSALPANKQNENAIETLEIYAPLAERVGVGEVKGQLEDLAFPFAYPKEFKKTIETSKTHYKEVESYIGKMRRVLLRKLTKEGIKAKIHGRKKHLYSLWKKLNRPEINWDFDKIHDVVAMRIIVNRIPQCYTALGVVHGTYRPVPNIGVSDFIAQPKPSGYRSIHTKVFGPGRRIVEIQIRTNKMHEQAEFGIAAHWAYGEAKSRGVKDVILEAMGVRTDENKLLWVKQLINWQKEITDSKEFLEAVKFDAFHHRNFIFSPMGDVYDLPDGSTPVDFAYAIHSDLGSYTKGARADGKMVPLDYKLKSGQVVEILKSKTPNVNADWLGFAVTTVARREIKKFIQGKTEAPKVDDNNRHLSNKGKKR
ncbi:RelA/SpoT family protein [Patescibacteria group bacterium]|nr:RelA/SpoT family protein [Patescibacteria group bacterium]MBU0776854.1 RelA/SpoT family protein [Patescibacteria group bacterium]MBU0846267.1 RelA/SpoT family protein [Patescibacteria group bacterium]MBU0922614.1 RelA/SpoT family protein [Patescibacteria group bacterium]MBU1066665.1 RelA/SpoT family protein [Patescibacteria group bacterium]